MGQGSNFEFKLPKKSAEALKSDVDAHVAQTNLGTNKRQT